jgi:hypothetical protein
MLDYFGKRVVKEPEPHKVLKTYNGWNSSFQEIIVPPAQFLPGTLYAETDVIPFSVYLKETNSESFRS